MHNYELTLTILICSSDSDLAQKIQTVLQQAHGSHVSVVTSKEELDVYLKRQYPAMVVIDEAFDNNGFKTCQQLRMKRGYAEQPMLMMISEPTPPTLQKLNACGATDFELKLSCDNVLEFRIEKLLQQSRLRHERSRLDELQGRHTDSLTGLNNRQHFKQKLAQCLERVAKQGLKGAVILVDLDNFKRVNNSFDYQTGDYLLKTIAKRLTSVVRESDILMRDANSYYGQQMLARLGGDEFTLFADDISNEADIVTIANRILASIKQPIMLDGHEVVISASIGIAVFPHDGNDVDNLMRNAEQAMYAAKVCESKIVFYQHDMESAARTRILLESEMRKAIGLDEFSVFYQPQIETCTGKVVRMEALCRWNHPKLGAIPPNEFIPVAEDSGLISALGDWVIIETCRQIRDWLNAGVACQKVAINVSAYQFYNPGFVDRMRGILELFDIEGKYLELELTETILMRDVEDNITKLEQLRELGISLAVDDFGTGYSSLSYLKRLPIDTLKIEKSFIQHLYTQDTDTAIVEAILALAARLNYKVVAEGVESPEQLQFLKEQGCHFIQGFLLSKPLCVSEAEKLFDVVLDEQPMSA